MRGMGGGLAGDSGGQGAADGLAGSGGVGDGAREPGQAAWRRGRGDHRWDIRRTIGEERGQMGSRSKDPLGDAGKAIGGAVAFLLWVWLYTILGC